MIGLAELLVVSLALNTVVFLFAYALRTDVLTDATYSLSFVVLVMLAVGSDTTFVRLLVAGMVVVWAARLGFFLVSRIIASGRDRRFDAIRGSLVRFFGFWMLQGLAAWIVLLPVFLFMRGDASSVWWLGILIWLIGLLIESIADVQKRRFSRERPGMMIDSGLWRYSRHPNYFGEILCWVGVYVFVVPSLVGLEPLIALASPLFIAFVLIFVTGIPPLERLGKKRWGRAYESYVERTSMLVPWPPRRR